MSLIGNEQAKLSATYLNGVAFAVAAVGGIAPWVTLVAQDSGPGAGRLGLIGVVCFRCPESYITRREPFSRS